MDTNKKLPKYSLALLKGGIGIIPGGSVIVELLNVTIPDNRIARIEKLLILLVSKGLDLESEPIRKKILESPEIADILEDVIHQTARTLSEDRLQYFASIIEQSLEEKQVKYNHTKRLLSILNEINDVEVIILQSYEFNHQQDKTFKEKHSNIFQYEIVSRDSSQEEKEENAMFKNYTNHLINLGLIGLTNSRFDNNPSLALTTLGAMLLKKIGVEKEAIAIGYPISPLSSIQSAETKYKSLQTEVKNLQPVKSNHDFRKSESQKAQELAKQLQKASRYL